MENHEFHCDEKENKPFAPRVKLNDYDKENVAIHIRYAFIIFIIIWVFIIISNKFYLSNACPVLLLPFGLFGLGILNSDKIADDHIEENVFQATFITIGLVISLPLLAHINKDKKNKELSHIIFLAMILTLCSYFHYWVDINEIHICKIIRSCFETMAVTLYIFTLVIFFVLT